ncbi:MAG: PEP-CTERM sorting domain-containing protein [Oceanipulchritudo sp.]
MKKFTLLIFSFAICFSLGAQVTIVAWGGDYVAANQNSQASLNDIAGVPTASDSIREIGDFGEAVNPAIGTDYSGTSAEFFGGSQIAKYGVNSSTGQALAAVRDGGASDHIYFRFQTPSGVTSGDGTAFALWNVSTTYGDLVSVTASSAGGMSSSVTSRIIINAGGSYYVSSESISGGFGGANWGLNSTELTSTDAWAVYNPGSDVWFGNLGSLSFDQTIGSGAEVTEIGWISYKSATSVGDDVTIDLFEVIAVPEPSTFALLVGMVALAGVLYRRRVK